MADPPGFESPVVRDYPRSDGDLTLTDVSPLSKVLVRAADGTGAARDLAVGFGRSRRAGEALVCGQRPGEWMVLGEAAAVGAVLDGLDRDGHVSVVDHTHARALFRLTGESSPAVLEKICSLDWDDAMTPDGAVVSASVAKVACDIGRDDIGRDDIGRDDIGRDDIGRDDIVGDDIGRDAIGRDIDWRDGAGVRSYLVACDRSFGQYLFDAIVDAGHELALAVTPRSPDF